MKNAVPARFDPVPMELIGGKVVMMSPRRRARVLACLAACAHGRSLPESRRRPHIRLRLRDVPDWELERMDEDDRKNVHMDLKVSLYDDLIIPVRDIFYKM